MKRSEVLALAFSLHSPEEAKKQGMVYQVWEDGEITLQKSGDLLWMRTLHCVHFGSITKRLDVESMPEEAYAHGFAFMKTREDAEQLSKAIMEMTED